MLKQNLHESKGCWSSRIWHVGGHQWFNQRNNRTQRDPQEARPTWPRFLSFFHFPHYLQQEVQNEAVLGQKTTNKFLAQIFCLETSPLTRGHCANPDKNNLLDQRNNQKQGKCDGQIDMWPIKRPIFTAVDLSWPQLSVNMFFNIHHLFIDWFDWFSPPSGCLAGIWTVRWTRIHIKIWFHSRFLQQTAGSHKKPNNPQPAGLSKVVSRLIPKMDNPNSWSIQSLKMEIICRCLMCQSVCWIQNSPEAKDFHLFLFFLAALQCHAGNNEWKAAVNTEKHGQGSARADAGSFLMACANSDVDAPFFVTLKEWIQDI